MSSDVVIQVESISKQYRLGQIGGTTLREDLQRWWARVRQQPDPTLKVTQTNVRDRKADVGGRRSEVGGQMSEGGAAESGRHSASGEVSSQPPSGSPPQVSGLTPHPSSPPQVSGLTPHPSSDFVWALKDVSFEVKRGEVLGIIGRNGAGKSTLLKILSRITAPTSGQIKVKGRIASLLEVGTGMHPELTGRENIYLNGAILGMTKAEITGKLDEIIDFSGVERYIDTPVKRYSSGMMVRLGFAVAAHLEPEILIVDEVLAVGDAEFQRKCIGKMQDVAGHGRTVLFVSHNMAAVAQLTSRCILMDAGTVALEAPTPEAVLRYTAPMEVDLMLGAPLPVTEIECERHVIIDDRAAFVSIGLSPHGSAILPSGGTLPLLMTVQTKCRLDALSIGYTVRDAFSTPVLNGYTPPFSISGPGTATIHLEIAKLLLAPGEYHLCLSINQGGLVGNKHCFDILMGLGRFRVDGRLQNGEVLPSWNPGWGQVIHTESSVRATASCGPS